MRYAADFRSIARDALRGRWVVAVIAGVIAALLGGLSSGGPEVNLEGTSKNPPFAIWPDLLVQQFVSKSPQYTKYSELSETFAEPKSLAQIIKKEFLEVAWNLAITAHP